MTSMTEASRTPAKVAMPARRAVSPMRSEPWRSMATSGFSSTQGAERSGDSGQLRCSPVLKNQRNDPGEERINTQRQSEEKCKTTYFRHVGEPRPIFSEIAPRGNRADPLARACETNVSPQWNWEPAEHSVRFFERAEHHYTTCPGSRTIRPHLRRTRLGGLLVVTLHHFALRCEPIVGLAAGTGLALLIEFVSAPSYFVFEINGNHILGLPNLEHLCFGLGFRDGFGMVLLA